MNLLSKLQALFADSKMRIVLILFIILLMTGTVSGIIFAIRYMTGPLGAEGEAQVKEAPHITSVVGGWDKPVSPEYRKSQEQFNREQVEKAKKTGTSAIPSLIESKEIPKDMKIDQSAISGGVGFSALKRSQEEQGQEKELSKNGKECPVGCPGSRLAGSVVYDANGNVIGTVGADGLVRDATGKIIGQVGPDGVLRDAQGHVIGKTGPAVGSLVYDANGNVIGTVGADGLVRDASGKVIGKASPDGTVVDLSGKPIAKVGPTMTGALMYDEKGNIIGTVGVDGLIRDADGKVVGKVLADGRAVDMFNQPIGKSAPSGTKGALAYDSNGNLIGTVGADGLIRDATGKVVSRVLPDGTVVDLSGKPIGKVSAAVVGAPVYDSNGNLIGTVGPDGLVRDASGRVLGKVSPDGTAVDVSGKPLGKVGPPPATASSPGAAAGLAPSAPSLPISTLPVTPGIQTPENAADARMKAAVQRQTAAISEQQRAQVQQQMQGAMAAQANQLFAAWASPIQAYVEGISTGDKEAATGRGGGSSGTGKGIEGTPSGSGKPPLVKGGSILFAVLDTAVNTDEPGPVMATIVQGDLKGVRLLGKVDRQQKKAMLSFTMMTGDRFSSKVSINAVAIDPDTARTALSSDTDSHYWLRYGSLFASSFVQGYATALTTSGTTVNTTPLGGTITSTPVLSPQGKLLVALGTVGNRYQSVLSDNFNTPPTVRIYSGVGLGILFLDDVAAP